MNGHTEAWQQESARFWETSGGKKNQDWPGWYGEGEFLNLYNYFCAITA